MLPATWLFRTAAPGPNAERRQWSRSLRYALWTIVAVTAGATGAHADCESGIAALASVLPSVKDTRIEAMLQTDLRRAQVDLWEFDEVECAMVLEHSARLLVATRKPGT